MVGAERLTDGQMLLDMPLARPSPSLVAPSSPRGAYSGEIVAYWTVDGTFNTVLPVHDDRRRVEGLAVRQVRRNSSVQSAGDT
jgi:hypothetical protein